MFSYVRSLNSYFLFSIVFKKNLSRKPFSTSRQSVLLLNTCKMQDQVTVVEKEDQHKFHEKSNADGDLDITDKLESTDSGSKETSNTKNLSKRAIKRLARAQNYKQMKKKRKLENLQLTGREEAGYNLNEFDQTSYYFENGLRKVYPYPYVFNTFAKGRWVGKVLKNILEKEFGFDVPSDVDKAFHEGKIHVNNVKASIDYEVKDCDYISHQIHRHENPVVDSAFEVLADNQDVVVINKPSSIPCHPCGRYRFNSIVFILGKEMGYSNLRNIYRLDRLTSGVLVLGKTAESTKRLENQVLNREVEKEYVCRVEGEFPCETVTVNQPLMALSNKLRLQIVSPKGKPSQTTFTRLSYNGRSSVVKCVPHTGRTHQIRVHLQYLGHPIINDVFYNSDAWGPNKAKGGVYELPHDTVCLAILKKHHATQWDGGENPLYHQKLLETQESERNRTSLIPSQDSEKVEDDTPATKDNSDLSRKNESKSPENNSFDCSERRPDTDSKETSSLPSDLQTNQVEDLSSKSDLETNLGAGETSDNEKQSRPGYDETKWHVDITCDMCRKTTLDPKPKDLVMFLHALKYKGPGWKYETELPLWAHNDWSDEDQFILESTSTIVGIEPDVH